MTSQAKLQAQLDAVATARAGVVFLPRSGDKDALRRTVCHQLRSAIPPDVMAAIDRAVDAAGVLDAIMRLDVKVEWV